MSADEDDQRDQGRADSDRSRPVPARPGRRRAHEVAPDLRLWSAGITHDMSVVADIADRVIVMHDSIIEE